MSGEMFSAIPLSAVRAGARWLARHSDEDDVVISSRVRLARNLVATPFPTRATDEQREAVIARVREHVDALGSGVLWVDVHKATPLGRALLVERRLMSREHAKGRKPRALAVTMPDESLSVMVNEEDHIRMQALRPGFDLRGAFEEVNTADDRFSAELPVAWSRRFGYLTACPTNVGGAIRVSAMLHLPALQMTGEISKVKRAARDMSMAVRGYYGEGSEAVGDFYQLSNQTTLGKPETLLLEEIEERVLPKVIEYERHARRMLTERRSKSLEDGVYRALGVLRGARLMTPEEAVSLLSQVRLGVLMGLITDVDMQAVNQLILLVQPAHLQAVVGRRLNQAERRVQRADLLRARLAASS